MAEFYHELIGEKSYRILQDLRRSFSFVLIGGWAVFLYAKTLKSKDIDIILDYEELERLRASFQLAKNDRLRKYEIKIEEMDVDIYTPYYSTIGLPVEEIQKYTQALEGFVVPIPEVLLLLKTYVARERRGTTKGKKDVLDIISLLAATAMDGSLLKKLGEQYELSELIEELKSIVSSQVQILELGLSAHQMARLKKAVLEKIDGV